MQAHGFRIYFTPLFGVLFTFPSRYWYAIGLPGVFSLARRSARIQAGFHVPRPTQGTAHLPQPPSKGLSPAMAALSSAVPGQLWKLNAALQPRRGRNRPGLGSSRFARRYSGNRCLFLFLSLLRCFSSAGWLLLGRYPLRDGLPHSETCGFCGRMRLPAAYRSLPRPSSPLEA